MSFETTLNKAIEDFKAKFVGQHREAMQHEFAQNYGELAELGIRAAEKVAMVKDAHKSLNEAEKVLGVELTSLPALGTALDGYAVVAGHAEAKTAAKAVEPTTGELKTTAMRKLKKAFRAYEKSMSGGNTQVSRDRVKRDLYVALTEGHTAGWRSAEMNRACKRSAAWSHNFMRAYRESVVL